MLVVSRNEGERIYIGNDITLVINRVEGRRVSIAIDAPKEIPIVRDDAIRTKTNRQDGASERKECVANGCT